MTEAPTPTDVSIVVPCYDRMALLERTLRACIAQRVPQALHWEIVVADNHAEQRGAALVAGLESPAPLRHVAAGVRNIAQARNRGIAAARGRFVAFVDDDEAPEPDWLANHFACLARTNADASFGPKFPEFEGGAAPDWDPQGWFYTVDFGMAEDEEIRPLDWWPPRGRGLGTGNSMLRVATCLMDDPPFDEAFGRTGGEDTKLFLGLAKRGRRFVWCASARVNEFNEAARLNPAYMRARLLRSAQHSAQVRLAISDNKLATRAGTALVGLAQLAVYGPLWAATRQDRYGMRVSKGLGKLGFGTLDFVPEPAGPKVGSR